MAGRRRRWRRGCIVMKEETKEDKMEVNQVFDGGV